jgi:uncharacterized protein YceH (UPF0502 family)
MGAALEALEGLVEAGHAVRHPRRPGQKEERYEQRLGDAGQPAAPGAGEVEAGPADPDRLASVERELGELRDEVRALREALGG